MAAEAETPIGLDHADMNIRLLANLVAAVSLLKRGGKEGAASDTIFDMMIADYERAIQDCRATLMKQTPSQLPNTHKTAANPFSKYQITIRVSRKHPNNVTTFSEVYVTRPAWRVMPKRPEAIERMINELLLKVSGHNNGDSSGK